ILEWAETICSERVIPFLSVYPQDKEAASQVFKARDAGFKGIKLHPYYQNFFLDDPEVFPVYEALSECGLILFCHTGFDIAYPRDRRAAPHRIANLLRLYPKLNFVATHCGAWFDWDEVRTYLLGRPVRIETAFSLEYMSVDFARDFLLSHPKEYLLFGTDSPWADQSASLALVRSLRLGAELESLLLGGNARALLGLSLNR
ncbi:MAG: amidohydrolase family protein, partial [Lentisphaerae bacterium]|nr:amidohydrolase family protein [Lentisphaerota bacterium]